MAILSAGTIPLIKPDYFNSLNDTLYSCIVCGCQVISEKNEAYDQLGNAFTIFSPISRYFCAEGVFCGIACSFKWYEDKNGKEH